MLRFRSTSLLLPHRTLCRLLATGTSPALPPSICSDRLAGTVPSHSCYILLHNARSPAAYPRVVESALLRALQLRAVKFRGLVNFAWREEFGRLGSVQASKREDGGEDEAYVATVFAAGRGRLDLPRVELANLDEVEVAIRAHALEGKLLSTEDAQGDEVHIYVCTHGARDCRCGQTGGAVVSALREELRKRQSWPPGDILSSRIKIGEVGHVGGHK